MQQIFAIGQGEDYRVSAAAFGFVSLRTSVRQATRRVPGGLPTDREDIPNTFRVSREDDSTLPVLAPKIELTKYFKDPILDGRLKTYGDLTWLSRANGELRRGEVATEYVRGTGGINYSKNWIGPAGIEIKPFADGRYDIFRLESPEVEQFEFSRALGNVGVDIRWPFMRPGDNVNWIIEPRVQVTQSFGDGKLENFAAIDSEGDPITLNQDGLGVDFDHALLWNANKSTGYDIWQEGFRADVGASLIADWSESSRAMLFLGQSFYSGDDNIYGVTTGLGQSTSDLVGLAELQLGKRLSTSTRVRYDHNENVVRRIDSNLTYRGDRLSGTVRYYKVNSLIDQPVFDPDDPNAEGAPAPRQEVSGSVGLKLIDNWSTKYAINYDIDADITRRQTLSLVYDDDCTRIEFIYGKKDNGLGLIEQGDEFGIRVSLLTLGAFSPE